jgi:hypothetical protein
MSDGEGLREGDSMKKRMLARVKALKTKSAQKRARHGPWPRAKDPRNLRGAKGALLKSAAEAALEDSTAEPGRHRPPRVTPRSASDTGTAATRPPSA